MIKRGGGQFDSSASSGITVGRYNARKKTIFSFKQSLQICAIKVSALLNEFSNSRIIQEELIEPCELGQYLKVGEVLRVEVRKGQINRLVLSLLLQQLKKPR